MTEVMRLLFSGAITNHMHTVIFPPSSSLIDILQWRALHQPDSLAYAFLRDGEVEEARLNYAELDLRVRALAARLLAEAPPGARALLLYPPGLDFVIAFWACLAAGVIAVPAYPPGRLRQAHRVKSILADSQARLVLTTAALEAKMGSWLAQENGGEGCTIMSTDGLSEGWAAQWQAPLVLEQNLAFLQYTSGSTAAPKGVMVSHGNLLHNLHMLRHSRRMLFEGNQAQLEVKSLIVGWLPSYHDMGLIGAVLQSVYMGGGYVLMSPTAFLQRPMRWLRTISHYGASMAGAPSFAYDLCVRSAGPEQLEGLDLSCLEVLYNGAEPIHHASMERFASHFAPCGFRREAFTPCYGLAEATLMVTTKESGSGPVVRRIDAAALEQHCVREAEGPQSRALVGCGPPGLGEQLAIVDPQTFEPCPHDRVGEIWVAGLHVAQGYWQRPKESQETFGARLAGGEGPFLRTGDLGFFREGQLFITGRIKDLIIIRGRNYYPQEIERFVEQSHDALRLGCCAAFSVEVEGAEHLVLVAEVERTHVRHLAVDEVVTAIRGAVSTEFQLPVGGVALIKTGGSYKTSSGKIQRQASRTAFLENKLEICGEWFTAALKKARNPELSSSVVLPSQRPPDPSAETPVASGNRPRPQPTASQIQRWLEEWLASHLEAAGGLDPSRAFADYGMDSLRAVELAADLSDWLQVPLDPTLSFSYPTISELVQHLAAPRSTPQAPTATHVLSELSEVEMYQLLAAELEVGKNHQDKK